MLNRFKGWLKERQSIEQPELLNLNIEEIVNDFGTTDETLQLTFVFPESAEISSDFTLSSHPLLADDLRTEN